MKQDREEALTLELLTAIAVRSDITQRHLARRLGVALGLANSYLNRCVRKGLVKVTQAPANRYLYYLTPKGFTEKSRLTVQYLSTSIDFYRRASGSLVEALGQCRDAGYDRVILIGVSEFAEIAAVRSHDLNITLLGTYDPEGRRSTLLSMPIWEHLGALPPCDAAVLTALDNCAARHAEAITHFGPTRVVVPEIVRPFLQLSEELA